MLATWRSCAMPAFINSPVTMTLNILQRQAGAIRLGCLQAGAHGHFNGIALPFRLWCANRDSCLRGCDDSDVWHPLDAIVLCDQAMCGCPGHAVDESCTSVEPVGGMMFNRIAWNSGKAIISIFREEKEA